MTILIAGGGIAGLALGLTLHEIGAPFRIYEASRTIRPLGVGINIQPNASRELIEMGLGAELDKIGVRTQALGFFSKHGHKIWTEPRGEAAGYTWPQYSVHRGKLLVMLYETLIARAGPEAVVTDARVKGFETGDRARLILEDETVDGDLLIACDGIHSAIRAQMVPNEGAPIWDGRVLWRSVSRAKAALGAGGMFMIGHDTQRIVAYPIDEPDPETGLCTLNWITEIKFDPAQGWTRDDWNKPVPKDVFANEFDDWRYDWFDGRAVIDAAGEVLEYPMVDRDPLDRWTHGRVTLLGDAAHATYPVGSNGASQAVIDARTLGKALCEHGVTTDALEIYEAARRPATNAVIRANRGEGPDAVMQWVEDRCGGVFDDIEDVVPTADLAAHAQKYRDLAGINVDQVNGAGPIIPKGARVA
ncbi:MAG: flavin-dependent oxidoreductase [Pseudomonadota bacterium]